jgi:hypothetical protein
MNMNLSNFVTVFENIRDILLCLGFLIGGGAGVFLITRQRVTEGIMTLAAFALFALEPLTDYILFGVLYSKLTDANMESAFSTVYYCLSTLVFLAGSALLVAAIFHAVNTSMKASPSNSNPTPPTSTN